VRYGVPGDRARRLADGSYEVLGREATTINSGGEKVFAEEIERALLDHPAVTECVVVGRPSQRWGEEVVAVVAVATGRTVDDEELGAHALARLARFKVPKAFVRVGALERTAAGKPDLRWARRAAADVASAVHHRP
jgi:3-oxocholest-4-en-26-oate---CoA ligase